MFKKVVFSSLIATLLLAPFAARASASFYLTYKYEQFVQQHLSTKKPVAQLRISRRELERSLRPLKPEEFRGKLPVIFGDERSVQEGYTLRYYLLHPALAGCHLYFVFDGPEVSSRLVGYRDQCE